MKKFTVKITINTEAEDKTELENIISEGISYIMTAEGLGRFSGTIEVNEEDEENIEQSQKNSPQ